MIKRHLRELSMSFGNQVWPEKSQELRRTKTDIENNSTVLQLIKSEGERQKEDNSRKETELEGLVEDIDNQYQSLDVPYDRLTGVYMKGAHHRIKRASSLSCSSLDSDYLSSDGTEFPDLSSRVSQRERNSALVNTVEALETQKLTETNELEANEVRQIRAKNAELEKALSELHVKLKNNEERAMSKTSDLMALIEEKVKRYRNEASKQKKEFADKINVMQQNLESVCNKNTDLESQLENQREKVSQYLIRIKNMEEDLAETVSTKQNLLKEKQCFIERIKELESQCSKEKDLEEQLRDPESVCNENTDFESQLENEREKVSQYLIRIKNLEENMAETVSTKQNLLKEKEYFIERIKELESQCSKDKDLEEQLRDLESVCNKNTDLEAQLENEREKVSQYLIRIKNLEENLAETVSTKQNVLKEKECFIERIKELECQCCKEKDLEEQLRELESVCNENTDLESQQENQREKVSQYLILIKNLEENLAETVSTKQNLLKEKESFIERIKELESQCSKEKDLEEQFRDAMWEINALHKKKIELKLQNEQSQKEYSETIKKLTETIDLTHEENKHSKMNKQLMERKMEELAEGVRQKMEDSIRILHRRVHVTELLNNENKDTCKSTKQKYEEERKMFGGKIADYEDEIKMLREKVLKLEADMSQEGEKMNLMKTVTQLESKMMILEKKLKEKDDELVSLGENKKEAIRQLCFLTEFHRDRCLNMKNLMLNMRIKIMK